MSKVDTRTVVHHLAERGYTVSPAAAEALAGTPDPSAAIAATADAAPEDVLTIKVEHIPSRWLGSSGSGNPPSSSGEVTDAGRSDSTSPLETEGSSLDEVVITGDVTGRSTGTGEYAEFVGLFRDRLDRLGRLLEGRVPGQSASALERGRGGSEAGMIGLVNDIRSTRNGHWMVELEDATGAFPALFMKDREVSELVDVLLYDEVIGVEGRLSDDAGILFVENAHVPDVPRTHEPKTADRHVQAAMISDIHVGSKEFLEDAWSEFTTWLHSDEAEAIEYLLIAGDMVEGVGVYPNQDEDLAIVDVYAQYEQFAEVMKGVPGDLELIMIPGNHDAVRLAEPQPAFPEELVDAMDAHEAHITANPSTVTVEGVPILMYHGSSLDEIIAQLPADLASYEEPHRAMTELLRKRHVAPLYGGKIRVAPEERDYLTIDEVPSVFHAGHVHTMGVGTYRNVRVLNTGCWQAQTDFQRRNNLEPEPGRAAILDLDTLDVTVRKFI